MTGSAYAKRETGTGNDKKTERKWKGISVSPYTVPALDNHPVVLGLPRVGEYDQCDKLVYWSSATKTR